MLRAPDDEIGARIQDVLKLLAEVSRAQIKFDLNSPIDRKTLAKKIAAVLTVASGAGAVVAAHLESALEKAAREFVDRGLFHPDGSLTPFAQNLDPGATASDAHESQAVRLLAGPASVAALHAVPAIVGAIAAEEKHWATAAAMLIASAILHVPRSVDAIWATQHLETENEWSMFATHVANTTNVSPQWIANASAAIYTVIVPACAIAAYCWMMSDDSKRVSDQRLLREVFVLSMNDPTMNAHLVDAWMRYPERSQNYLIRHAQETLLRGVVDAQSLNADEKRHLDRFARFVLKTLPSDVVDSVKRQILLNHNEYQAPLPWPLRRLETAAFFFASLAPIFQLAAAGGSVPGGLPTAAVIVGACGTMMRILQTSLLRTPCGGASSVARALGLISALSSACSLALSAAAAVQSVRGEMPSAAAEAYFGPEYFALANFCFHLAYVLQAAANTCERSALDRPKMPIGDIQMAV